MVINEFPLIEMTEEALRENAISLLGNEYSVEKEKQLLDCFFENERKITNWCLGRRAAISVLENFNTILGFHGIESLYDQNNPALNGHAIYYCNSGDTYNQTIIWIDSENCFYIGDWGSLLEYLEEEYDDEKSPTNETDSYDDDSDDDVEVLNDDYE